MLVMCNYYFLTLTIKYLKLLELYMSILRQTAIDDVSRFVRARKADAWFLNTSEKHLKISSDSNLEIRKIFLKCIKQPH